MNSRFSQFQSPCVFVSESVRRLKDPLGAGELVGAVALDHADMPWN